MYRPDMLDEDLNTKNGGPQRLSSTQALVLRAAACSAPSSSGPTRPGTPSTSTTEGEDSVDEWYQAHPEVPKCGKEVSSRLPTPLNSDNQDDADEMTEDQKRCLASAKRKSARQEAQVELGIQGKWTRVNNECSLPIFVPYDAL
jgi:hypothetical protein